MLVDLVQIVHLLLDALHLLRELLLHPLDSLGNNLLAISDDDVVAEL